MPGPGVDTTDRERKPTDPRIFGAREWKAPRGGKNVTEEVVLVA